MTTQVRTRIFAACALALAAAPSRATAEDIRIGVSDFQAPADSASYAGTAAGMVANELTRIGVFDVSTAEAMRDLLAHERTKQILGCDSDTCAAGLQKIGMLGVEYLITGKVSRISGGKGMPSTVTLELSLLSVKSGRREASDIQLGQSEADLNVKIRKSVIKLTGKLLAGRQGVLLATIAEPGATVTVDDAVVGTTPFAGRLELPAGPHFVQVEKKGFVTAQKEVRIRPAQVDEESFTLVPSPDFVRDYEASNGKMRLAAWIGSGVAAAGAIGFVALQLRAGAVYGSPDTLNSFQYHRAKLLQGLEIENGVDHRAAVVFLGGQINTAQNLSYVAAGVGAAAAVTAGYFWIAGDDPGRYARFRQKVSLGLAPAPGGAFASFGLQW